MTLVPTSTLITNAQAAGHGLAAFNVITLEHIEAVVRGAEEAGTPVIVQISENAVKFHAGRPIPLTRAASALAESATVGVGLHLDHVTDMALLHQAADAGFSSAMFDAAHET